MKSTFLIVLRSILISSFLSIATGGVEAQQRCLGGPENSDGSIAIGRVPCPTPIPIPVPSPSLTPVPIPSPTATATRVQSPPLSPSTIPLSSPIQPLSSTPTTGRMWYAHARGEASGGNGTQANPWSLTTALSHPALVKPGDKILVLRGHYNGAYDSKLAGIPGRPIIIEFERGVVIDQNNGVNNDRRSFTIRGQDTEWWNLHLTDSSLVRSTTIAGSHPPDVPRGYSSVAVYGPRTKLINPLTHDVGNGMRFWASAIDSEVYGLISFNNGFHGPDRGHGHNMYIQNEKGTKKVREAILFNNFRNGINAYAETGTVKNLIFEGLIIFNSASLEALFPGSETIRRETNLLVGTTTNPPENIRISNSHFHIPDGTYGTNMRLGYQRLGGTGLEVVDNYISGGFRGTQITRWTSFKVRGNVSVRYRAKYGKPVFLDFVGTEAAGISDNSYLDALPNTDGSAFAFNGTVEKFALWQARGFDANSTYKIGKPSPSVHIRPNAYEKGRCNIVVYNWDHKPSVSVDLAACGQTTGMKYEIRDVQNFLGTPVTHGMYNGQPITVPLTNRTVAIPIGMTRAPEHTGPDLFVFVVLPK